jgi:excisionase family DNA binding protein
MDAQAPTRDGRVRLTPAHATAQPRVSKDTIYREIDRGSLRAVRAGRSVRIAKDDVDRWMEA